MAGEEIYIKRDEHEERCSSERKMFDDERDGRLLFLKSFTVSDIFPS